MYFTPNVKAGLGSVIMRMFSESSWVKHFNKIREKGRNAPNRVVPWNRKNDEYEQVPSPTSHKIRYYLLSPEEGPGAIGRILLLG